MANETKRRSSKRRGNGEGSIYQRATGRWEAIVTVGYNGQGKRVRRTVYGWTKKEVQDKLTELQSKKLDGSLAERSNITVADFLKLWLETVARPSIRATTHANYQTAVDKHVSPTLGGLQLSRIIPAHVQGLYAELSRQGIGPHTRRLVHAVLRRSFKQAVKWGMMPRNVCDAVEAPRIPKSEIKPLSASQTGKLLATARGDRLEALYVLAVSSGLRLGELFGLQWEDVDLAGRALTVRHTMTELKGMLTLSEPKTDKSRRRVELPQIAVQALHEHRKRGVAEGNAGVPWVFCNTLGGPLRRSHFHRQAYKPLLKRAELPDIRFHDLRHSHATLLLSQGVHPKIVQERLGHSQIGVTMDTYSHVLPTMQKQAASQLDRLLTASEAKQTRAAAGA